jgi:aspartate 1-decarboxylase
MLQVLRTKIQELRVTESSIDYPGSISLPEELMLAAGVREFEMVYVNNKTNGNRIVTYAVRSLEPGFVSVNGAASKLFSKNDIIHVLAYGFLNESDTSFRPTLVIADSNNRLVTAKPYVMNHGKQQ